MWDKNAQTEQLTEVDKKYQELVDKIKRLETDRIKTNFCSVSCAKVEMKLRWLRLSSYWQVCKIIKTGQE